jgi:hypothetical protein
MPNSRLSRAYSAGVFLPNPGALTHAEIGTCAFRANPSQESGAMSSPHQKSRLRDYPPPDDMRSLFHQVNVRRQFGLFRISSFSRRFFGNRGAKVAGCFRGSPAL